MKWYDYVILGAIAILVVFITIYLIKNKGCPDSSCQQCLHYNECKKSKKIATRN